MKQWLTHPRNYLPHLALSVVMVMVWAVLSTTPALADNETTFACKDGTRQSGQVGADPETVCKDHGGYQASTTPAASGSESSSTSDEGPSTDDPTLKCTILPQDICDAAKSSGDTKSSGIFLFLRWILNILTAVVGIAAVGTLTWAGIMYSSAGDDSGMVSKAKTIIRDTIIGIVAYGLMVIVLNWIIPGGVIG